MTALMERAAFARFDALRRAHFPPERNFIPAHLTLFYHLPGPRAETIVAEVKDAARHEAPMPARTTRLHFTGRGTAILIACPELRDFRARLAERWSDLLVPQDRQGWRPHVTVQNKVDAAEAKATYVRLEQEFTSGAFRIDGVTLWWYRGGPWEKLRDVRFRRAG